MTKKLRKCCCRCRSECKFHVINVGAYIVGYFLIMKEMIYDVNRGRSRRPPPAEQTLLCRRR